MNIQLGHYSQVNSYSTCWLDAILYIHTQNVRVFEQVLICTPVLPLIIRVPNVHYFCNDFLWSIQLIDFKYCLIWFETKQNILDFGVKYKTQIILKF